jgi:hypothetical protein
LNEGFEINSLLLKYSTINISGKSNWDHTKWTQNKYTCPEIPGNYDGIDVTPFELIFIKNIRRKHRFRSWRHSGLSKTLEKYINTYTRWMKQ